MHFLPTSGLSHHMTKAGVGILSKLSWDVLYGLGFGAGIGFAFFAFQKRDRVQE